MAASWLAAAPAVLPATAVAQEPGTLSITTVPPGAECFLNGEAFGRSPCSVAPRAAGPHALELRLEHHVTYSEKLTLAPHEQVARQVVLSPQAVQVRIGSSPGEAQAVIRAARSGDAPVARGPTPLAAELRPGRYVVALTKEGHAEMVRDLEVVPGRALTVTVDLPKARPPVPYFETTPIFLDHPAVIPADYTTLKWGWAITLSAVTAAAGGVTLWQALAAQEADVQAATLAYRDRDLDDVVAAGQQAAMIADVGMGVTAASALVTSFLWYLVIDP